MYINRRIFFITTFCLLFVVGLQLNAEEKTLTLGGKDGWNNISKMEGLSIGRGQYGYDSIQLATNSKKLSSVTDLLIDFDEKTPSDVSGNYNVVSSSLLYTTSSKMGNGAALSRGEGGIRLRGNAGSVFGSSGNTGSFIMEFWLCPSIAENGEIVFAWRSSRNNNNYLLYQMISASFYGNRLRWDFTNVFNGYTQNGGQVSISSYRTIIPNVWMHHEISYNEDTGLLEYRINGKLEGLKYITSNEQESGNIYSPILGVVADIEICSQFTGKIDDFCIKRTSVNDSAEELRYDTYRTKGGRFESEPIKISRNATLTRLDAIMSEPEQTDIVLYVRSGDNYFKWNDEEPAWIAVSNHKQIENVKGLYFQIAADLYPDGDGNNTPSITQIDVSYTETQAPLPPFTLLAEPGDGTVTLTWSYSVDDSAGGYYVYYGERPGEYLGRIALQGESPLNVGNVAKTTLTGLKNGQMYYFTVAAYSKYDEKIIGIMSKEAHARPLKR